MGLGGRMSWKRNFFSHGIWWLRVHWFFFGGIWQANLMMLLNGLYADVFTKYDMTIKTQS